MSLYLLCFAQSTPLVKYIRHPKEKITLCLPTYSGSGKILLTTRTSLGHAAPQYGLSTLWRHIRGALFCLRLMNSFFLFSAIFFNGKDDFGIKFRSATNLAVE